MFMCLNINNNEGLTFLAPYFFFGICDTLTHCVCIGEHVSEQ